MYIEEYNKRFDKEIVNKIPWLLFYEEAMKRPPKKYSLHVNRSHFYKIAHEREMKMDRFMGIDEFEVEFIKYLIEKGEVAPMPEVFNPYGELVTFYDYLK